MGSHKGGRRSVAEDPDPQRSVGFVQVDAGELQHCRHQPGICCERRSHQLECIAVSLERHDAGEPGERAGMPGSDPLHLRVGRTRVGGVVAVEQKIGGAEA